MPSLFKKGDFSRKSVGPSTAPSAAVGPDSNGIAPPTYDASANDAAVANGQGAYGQPSADDPAVNLTAAFENLKLSNGPGFPDVDRCLAHLKLLSAFQSMKEEVGYTDGLWNIWDNRADGDEILVVDGPPADVPMPPHSEKNMIDDKKLHRLSKIREKRWALFVARAVDRYEAWWAAVSTHASPLTLDDMGVAGSPKYDKFTSVSTGLQWTQDSLPPLDVLMVMHAHMLNPRGFLEDCLLAGLQGYWTTGMPWQQVNAAISTSFDYNVSDDCKAAWVAHTGRAWHNPDDSMTKTIRCPACQTPLDVPWTTCGLDENAKTDRKPGVFGNGYGDGDFSWTCHACAANVDKELLALGKFIKDTGLLLTRKRPMPGTVLEPRKGQPDPIPAGAAVAGLHATTFPDRMLQYVLRIKVNTMIQPGANPKPTMENVRQLIEVTLADQTAIKTCDGLQGSSALKRYRLQPNARIAVRKMMAHYWENFSPFALDLSGAVMRQGIFTEKMVKIDWLHSPAATDTMGRLVTKYARFINIMATNPNNTAVPTLDIDLAWHTHQLSPANYYQYTVSKCQKFIDHDDKIDEDKLNTSFEWTSKVYQEKYGEPYSNCSCWYCESGFLSSLLEEDITLISYSHTVIPHLKRRQAAGHLEAGKE
jgi:hypothetical protein